MKEIVKYHQQNGGVSNNVNKKACGGIVAYKKKNLCRLYEKRQRAGNSSVSIIKSL